MDALGRRLGRIAKLRRTRGIVYWHHQRAQREYEAHSRYWIWIGEYSGYVIMISAQGEVEALVVAKSLAISAFKILSYSPSVSCSKSEGLLSVIFHLPFFCWALRICVSNWPQNATECEIRLWCSCTRSSTWISAIQHAIDSSKPDLQLKLSNVLLPVLCFSSTFHCFMIKLSFWAYVFRKTE